MKKTSPSTQKLFWLSLILLGLAGIALAWLTTTSYGAGVGADGAIQLSTADHLIAGRGFFDYAGEPYTRWPPLYPALLADIARLSGIDTFTLGWLLNVFLMGVIVWLGGALLLACFPDNPLWALAGGLVLLTSVSLLSICANIGTDPLFTALVMGFLLAAGKAVAATSWRGWLALALLAGLASLQRLPGVALIVSGAFLYIYAQRTSPRQGFIGGFLFSALTALPLAVWVIGHNYLGYNTLFGVYAFQATYPLANLKDMFDKVFHWFVPLSAGRTIPMAVITIIALTLVLVSRSENWRKLSARLQQPPILASLVFGAIYLVFLVFTTNSVDTSYTYFDRYYIALLPPLLILAFAILQSLPSTIWATFQRWARLIGLMVFAVWLIYPAYSVYKYIVRSRSEGVASYNKYNTRQMQQAEIIRVVKELSDNQHLALYSNYPAAVWFYTRQEAFNSPRGEIVGTIDIQEILKTYKGWPYDQPGYLIWFVPNEYNHVLEPRLLAHLAELRVVYRGKDGLIYQIRAR